MEFSDWITTEEAAKISGYHLDHLRRLIRSGRIFGRKFGPVWQVDRDSLIRYLKDMETGGERRGPKAHSK